MVWLGSTRILRPGRHKQPGRSHDSLRRTPITTPTNTARVPLSRGQYALVDKEDLPLAAGCGGRRLRGGADPLKAMNLQTEWEMWLSCRRWLETEVSLMRCSGDAEGMDAALYALEVVDRFGMATLAAVPPANRAVL